MARILGKLLRTPRGINDFEVSHHPGRVVLKNVAMVHPLSWAIIRDPCDLYLASGREIDRIFYCYILRRFSIDFKYVKEKSMQVKGVVHQTCIPNLPYLQITDVNRRIDAVQSAVHREINSSFQARVYGEFYFSRNGSVMCCQWFYRAELQGKDGA